MIAIVLGAAAGILLGVAALELARATPALGAAVERIAEPLIRAGREGYRPSAAEHRRLGLAAAGALFVGALVVSGRGVAPLLALAGPLAAGWVIERRRAAYRRRVELRLPEVARSCADALAAGRPLRSALGEAARSVPGPAGVELARIDADLQLGAPIAAAIAPLARLGSPPAESLLAILHARHLSGPGLVGLLRRYAEAMAIEQRTVDDARSATAQARFTGMVVVAMPVAALVVAELAQPGFTASLLGNPAAGSALLAAAALQLVGFLVIRQLARPLR
ncbi:MAG: type II secretion system F family protein [Solirubrobacterales bacterium]